MTPHFSVVIPTFHRVNELIQCLGRLAPGKQTADADEYEVIVSDDGCDATLEAMLRARYPWVKWTPGPQRGPAANRNNGASMATGEWLILTDDDCLPDAKWLAAFSEAIRSAPDEDVFEGRTYPNRPKQSLAETAPVNESGDCLYSCNLAIRRVLFLSIGGFNELFPHAAMEDIEFGYRLRQRVSKVTFVKEASVCHPWRRTGGWTYLQKTNQSVLIYLALHPEVSTQMSAQFYCKHSAYLLLMGAKAISRMDVRGFSWSVLRSLATLQLGLILICRSGRWRYFQPPVG